MIYPASVTCPVSPCHWIPLFFGVIASLTWIGFAGNMGCFTKKKVRYEVEFEDGKCGYGWGMR